MRALAGPHAVASRRPSTPSPPESPAAPRDPCPMRGAMPAPRLPRRGPLRWRGGQLRRRSRPRHPAGRQLLRFRDPPAPRPRGLPTPGPASTHFPIVRGSAIDGRKWSAGDARNPLRIIELGSGGQGRNRTSDTLMPASWIRPTADGPRNAVLRHSSIAIRDRSRSDVSTFMSC